VLLHAKGRGSERERGRPKRVKSMINSPFLRPSPLSALSEFSLRVEGTGKGKLFLADPAPPAAAGDETRETMEAGREGGRASGRTPETSNRSPTALLANSPGNSIISALRSSRERVAIDNTPRFASDPAAGIRFSRSGKVSVFVAAIPAKSPTTRPANEFSSAVRI